jgi:biopolymer transport protein ExbD
MAEIAEGGGGGHGKGKKRAKKSSTRVDMTPMVDLAFLLLTFFVLTSTFSKPKVMSLVYPAKVEDPKLDVTPMNNGITFLLSEDKIFYYEGQYYSKDNPGPKGPTVLEETNFGPEGLRKLLAEKNELVLGGKEELDKKFNAKQIDEEKYHELLTELKKNDDALKVLIKTDDKATCKNFIDMIDELKIAEIGVIAPVDLLASELELMKEKL